VKKYFMFSSIVVMALFCSSCVVLESTYVKKSEEADSLSRQLAATKAQRDELDKVLKSKSDDLSKTIADSRVKIADLEAQNSKLKENVTQLQAKSQEVEKESKTYKDLVSEMKGEIAQGQVTITELKGKLTMDVVDKILFASGESKVKKEGLDVLNRVVEILKNVKDKNIRIEGHTDNVPITPKLAVKYPTNWELAAARAINVAKYLQEQGIDPKILSATSFGEYQPLADNDTPEGRAKNRRIAIILLPKE
jgi:chemotaxis protein MotB